VKPHFEDPLSGIPTESSLQQTSLNPGDPWAAFPGLLAISGLPVGRALAVKGAGGAERSEGTLEGLSTAQGRSDMASRPRLVQEALGPAYGASARPTRRMPIRRASVTPFVKPLRWHPGFGVSK
jgi:hypothetical protein